MSADFLCKHSECMAGEGKIWKLLPATYLKLRHCHSNCLSVLTHRTSISREWFSCDSHEPFEVMQDAHKAWGTWNAKARASGLNAANEEVSLSYWEKAFMNCNRYNLSWWMMDIYLVLQNFMTNDSLSRLLAWLLLCTNQYKAKLLSLGNLLASY